MKNIIFVRHAKSSWENPDLADRDRPLKKRGLSDAQKMSEHLLSVKKVKYQQILTSPANRAFQTAKIFSETLNSELEPILRPELYFEGPSVILQTIRMYAQEDTETLILFGHNPDIASLVSDLTEDFISHYPTCGVAMVKLNIHSWQEIRWGVGKLDWFIYPKMMPWHTEQRVGEN